MRHSTLAFGVALALAIAGCGPKPKPAPASPPPVAPETPPPAPQPPPEQTPQLNEYEQLRQKSIDELEKMGLLQDIHFDLDRADLRDTDRGVLSQNADTLKKFDFLRITVEGHCDERGSVEYNLALGERRASAVRTYLTSLGVGGDRVTVVSKGKEQPFCNQESESCWQQNRRGHFVITAK
jgi:peptidoglycan-associated lipoprotein